MGHNTYDMIVKEEERKLIDEFMGYNSDTVEFLEWWLGKWYILMSIVRKIESFKHVNGSPKYTVRIERCTVDIIDNFASTTFIGVDAEWLGFGADSKDIAVYKAVIEFIKYYNEYDKNLNLEK